MKINIDDIIKIIDEELEKLNEHIKCEELDTKSVMGHAGYNYVIVNDYLPLTRKKSDTLTSLKNVINTIDGKCEQYAEDPIGVLSVDDLLTQIKIKAVRAQLTKDKQKLEDELLDVAVYAILTLDKVMD